jgi:hypothetical protein
MRKGTKIVLFVSLGSLIVLATVAVLALVGIRYIGRTALDTQGEAWTAGRRFGEAGTLDKRACEQEALMRGDKCGLNASCRFPPCKF